MNNDVNKRKNNEDDGQVPILKSDYTAKQFTGGGSDFGSIQIGRTLDYFGHRCTITNIGSGSSQGMVELTSNLIEKVVHVAESHL
jgi:hypothetical protein